MFRLIIKYANNNRGLTLIEIMATIVIMGLVLTGLYSMFHGSLRSYTTSQEMVNVQQKERQLDYIVRELRPLALSDDYIKINENNGEIKFKTNEQDQYKKFYYDDGQIYHDTGSEKIQLISNVTSFSVIEKNKYIAIEVGLNSPEGEQIVDFSIYPRFREE
ncbi:PilW family protein [Natranaerobius thermophilus]|uniref:Prepilin-type N-terminal cleavage/methylation domain-containing protein n=1 Tax=Natranaerobius thermophilus (strain ATCC BAA-1301 / DSM 18059 / JW/NM-WN-LF) TaxID=457570 RepID=B2A7F0_NATTJ|nr:prepilin-type N-terminal cleavage/methylation domain-containing protein [Natranaerobius thermophilus]ACB85659.1 hypothetical protein Nther_2092 [Natranaerobius thermophilus JW/NM-WN-LF]